MVVVTKATKKETRFLKKTAEVPTGYYPWYKLGDGVCGSNAYYTEAYGAENEYNICGEPVLCVSGEDELDAFKKALVVCEYITSGAKNGGA